MDIARTFAYHAPKGDQALRYEQLRHAARVYAFAIKSLCPESAEQTIALRKLQEASMFANAAIAINEAE